jgi:hypothetical protein
MDQQLFKIKPRPSPRNPSWNSSHAQSLGRLTCVVRHMELCLADQRVRSVKALNSFPCARFRLADDLPYLFLASIPLNQCHGGAKFDRIPEKSRYIDYFRRASLSSRSAMRTSLISCSVLAL